MGFRFQNIKNFFIDLKEYISFLRKYFYWHFYKSFHRFEKIKDVLVGGLVIKRGKYVRPFLHTSMSSLFLIGLMIAPLIRSAFPENEFTQEEKTVLALGSVEESTTTQISVKPRDTVVSYTVREGDTISSISQKFGVSEETILWQNDLKKEDLIKPEQKLEIPPVTGIVHKVQRGETIYSIAKKYSVDAQTIVNWPFNNYANDETFALAVGQLVIVPDGVKPKEAPPVSYLARLKQTPSAGAISGTGQFVWPAGGSITQNYTWYHPATDIANNSAPDVLAADSGTVISVISQRYAYGNHIIIDHGNGFSTLYAHLSAFYVTAGQTVKRGDAVGKMGSTGRSTGIHLHFEIRSNGVSQNPLGYLK